MMGFKTLFLFTLLVQLKHLAAFYLPGVNPKSFAVGEEVKLKVNKLTSTKTLLPIEYYHLPFCRPGEGTPKIDHENFGELLAGDRIEQSPYTLKMKEDMYCEQVCVTNLGRGEHENVRPNKIASAIHNGYHANWIADNLSAASKMEDDKFITTQYSQGFPIGFVHKEDKKAYVHNHVNIELEYHLPDSVIDGGDQDVGKSYRIVRFTVEPFSIKHDFEPLPKGSEKPANIVNPIRSCDPTKVEKKHTDYAMIIAGDMQEAAGKVLFTYDVIWNQNTTLHWANRWDIYLNMDNRMTKTVRWIKIVQKMIIVVVLSAMVMGILVRNLRRDFSRYNRVPVSDEERAEALDEYGWKLVHGDVFRPPTTAPMFFAVCCGTGAQLLVMTLATIAFAALGFMNPARRGRLVMAEVFLFVAAGSVAGYVTARLYKTFKGKSWYQATLFTALGFPGVAFAIFFVMNIVAISQGSSDAVPVLTVVILLVLWFGFSAPLVFLGAFLGYRQDAIEFPVNTSGIPRQVPDQPFFLWAPCTAIVCGVIPYGSCILEMRQILDSVWEEHFYYVFGFLLLVFVIFLVTSAEITVLFTYFQLCSEDHRWWWRSFLNAGSASAWVMLYASSYFNELEANTLATYVLYFGYMTLICLGLLCMLGVVGVASSLWFNKVIYGSIKID